MVFKRAMTYLRAMKRLSKRGMWALLVAASGLTSSQAWAEAVSRSYDAIPARNAFNLQEPKPPPAPPPPEPVNPPNLKLTGISTIFSVRKAHLMLLEPGNATPKFYSLPVAGPDGPEAGGLRVLDINPEAGSVKVLLNQKELELTFEKDGLTNPVTPVAVAAAQRVPGGSTAADRLRQLGAPQVPPPASVPGAFGAGQSSPPIPTRTLRTAGQAQPTAGAGLNLSFQQAPPPVAQVWNRSQPQNAAPTDPSAAPTSNLTPEEAIVLMEINREVHREDIAAGRYPPLPPTPLTPPQDLAPPDGGLAPPPPIPPP
jgi:hypothetical protein